MRQWAVRRDGRTMVWTWNGTDEAAPTGYIDLSKRRVSAEDVIKCEERYNKSKAVHSIMRHVAEKTGVEMDLVNDLVAWPLYKKYGHAYEAFKLSITYVSSHLSSYP